MRRVDGESLKKTDSRQSIILCLDGLEPPRHIASLRTLTLVSVRFHIVIGVALSLSTLALVDAAAQQPSPQYPTAKTVPYTPASGRCLTAMQRRTNDQYNQLDRPTRPGDDMMFWDPEYFVGTWDIDMRNQESPLGPGGQSVGTLTIKANAQNGCLYEGTLKAEDPDGKTFTRTIAATYEPIEKVLTWTEKDSRGYTIMEKGPIGGELGGLFHYHFGDDPSTPASTFAGHTFRIKGVVEMSSPSFFKTDLQISLDNQPFKTFGRMMADKQLPDAK